MHAKVFAIQQEDMAEFAFFKEEINCFHSDRYVADF